MRYKFTEFAPSNQRQYFFALGLKDMKIMAGLAQKAYDSMPKLGKKENPAYDEVRIRLRQMVKSMTEAISEAEVLEDTGKRRKPWGSHGD